MAHGSNTLSCSTRGPRLPARGSRRVRCTSAWPCSRRPRGSCPCSAPHAHPNTFVATTLPHASRCRTGPTPGSALPVSLLRDRSAAGCRARQPDTLPCPTGPAPCARRPQYYYSTLLPGRKINPSRLSHVDSRLGALQPKARAGRWPNPNVPHQIQGVTACRRARRRRCRPGVGRDAKGAPGARPGGHHSAQKGKLAPR